MKTGKHVAISSSLAVEKVLKEMYLSLSRVIREDEFTQRLTYHRVYVSRGQ